MSDTPQPDIGSRPSLSQPPGCQTRGVGEGVVATGHINGNDFSKVGRFDLRSDVPLVDFVAQSRDFISPAIRRPYI